MAARTASVWADDLVMTTRAFITGDPRRLRKEVKNSSRIRLSEKEAPNCRGALKRLFAGNSLKFSFLYEPIDTSCAEVAPRGDSRRPTRLTNFSSNCVFGWRRHRITSAPGLTFRKLCARPAPPPAQRRTSNQRAAPVNPFPDRFPRRPNSSNNLRGGCYAGAACAPADQRWLRFGVSYNVVALSRVVTWRIKFLEHRKTHKCYFENIRATILD
ncbi:hypothetical protein EVAR_26415_1 [Eumeta japonica]|uniref:Uncharacterized protein n=1 Tax=Eumeta variegata TaxID=151549 RepID=A0A4C1VQU2_EUMVA|nr:hypothetical protein EVAR_26415_1 [Eumeta japonica]